MSKPENISLYEFFQKFPNEESARVYFETQRWNGSTVCPHCGSETVSECKDHKPMPYRCKSCRKHFSVRTGTVLAESRLPLHKWMMAMYMLTTARKGISSVQMAKELGVTQKTAWFLAQRIRECWTATNGDNDKMDGTVEIDEAYMGGKAKNKHRSKSSKVGGGASGKSAVVGIISREGEVRAKHVAKTDIPSLHGFIEDNVEDGTNIYTDEYPVYKGLNNYYNHQTIKHSVGEYVRGQVHTNSIESFWALLKRGHYGIYHYMSAKHLHRYVTEFSHRHNTREYGTMNFISSTIQRASGKRLKYVDLING